MKHDRHPRPVVPLVFAAACALAVAFGPATGTRARAQTAPPAPPVPVLNPTPVLAPTPLVAPTGAASGAPADAASGAPAVEPSAAPTLPPTPAPRRHGRHRSQPSTTPTPSAAPAPSATPTSPAFATLDGTWETQLQYIDHTDYSYLAIHQTTGGTLAGEWRVNGKQYPLDGTYDGRLVRLTAKEPSGSVTFSGYVEGASDMIGQVDLGKADKSLTPFTAEHRGFTDNNPLHAFGKKPKPS